MKSKVLLDIIEGFDVYSSFIFVRKFKFCVSAIVKRYPGLSILYRFRVNNRRDELWSGSYRGTHTHNLEVAF